MMRYLRSRGFEGELNAWEGTPRVEEDGTYLIAAHDEHSADMVTAWIRAKYSIQVKFRPMR